MSRFILNLRTLDQSPVLTSISVETQAATSVRFASGPFDNLGAPLDVDDENLRELDEEEGNEEEDGSETTIEPMLLITISLYKDGRQ